jgi:hypothetical protein
MKYSYQGGNEAILKIMTETQNKKEKVRKINPDKIKRRGSKFVILSSCFGVSKKYQSFERPNCI